MVAGNSECSRVSKRAAQASLPPGATLIIAKQQEWLKQMEGILEILNEGVGITDGTGPLRDDITLILAEIR